MTALEIVRDGIRCTVNYNTAAPGWVDKLRIDVEDVVSHRSPRNSIKTDTGAVIYQGEAMFRAYDRIVKAHTVLVPNGDPYFPGMVKKIDEEAIRRDFSAKVDEAVGQVLAALEVDE